MARRRLPIGAELLPDEGVHFRVWAPRRKTVHIVLEGQEHGGTFSLSSEGNGYFSGNVQHAVLGSKYRYRLDDDPTLYPDPASRFQPEGVHGPSQVVDASRFHWTDSAWPGVGREGQVIYEIHVGTFTPEGTWDAAARELPELAALGITVVEMMPVADFSGNFGWGYDGVDLFAPTRLYGSPDDLRHFVDAAHAVGIGVILDVVYNHFGPDGNYLKAFAEDYFTDRYENEWGEAINFDGANAGPVREFFLANARCWIDEFHFDGLRLDATQQIFDDSPEHILSAITREVRQAGKGKATLIVAENEPQEARLVRPEAKGGLGMDALWNDDFHHTAMVALTGHNEAYYTDYHGTPQEFISAIKWGFLYQGQRYQWQKQRRGSPALDLQPANFVTFLQNHDQVANSGLGKRCHALSSPGQYRALTALLLLTPATPMLFQGQEFAASTPFLFFADHHEELSRLVRAGRSKFLSQFPSIALSEAKDLLADPGAFESFARCKLDLGERQEHAEIYALHRDLLHLRRSEPIFRGQRRGSVDGAVLGPDAFCLRFFGDGSGDRLMIVNLGRDLHLDPAPEPLLAPPENAPWEVLWSSEACRYGGGGCPPLETEENWKLPGLATVVLHSQPRREP